MNTHYHALKFLKSPKAGNLLDVLIDAISCMNGRKMIMLFIGRKEKQKTQKENKIKSITGQICYAIWQMQEVKSTIDALEKQTTSAYNKAKNSGSDLHALVVVYNVNHIIHNTGSLRNFLTKDSRVEKEAGTRAGRS